MTVNKNIIMCSFKSSRDIQKKEGGPDSCFGCKHKISSYSVLNFYVLHKIA